jgi:hypothetical protein
MISDKLNRLFEDINQYYSEYEGYIIRVREINEWIKEGKPVLDFFVKVFEEREFNVKVTDNYLNKILKEYELSFDEIEKYVNFLKVQEATKKESEKKTEKVFIIIVLTFISLITILIIYISFSKNISPETKEIIEQRFDTPQIQLDAGIGDFEFTAQNISIYENPSVDSRILNGSKTIFYLQSIDNNLYNSLFRKVKYSGNEGYVIEKTIIESYLK